MVLLYGNRIIFTLVSHLWTTTDGNKPVVDIYKDMCQD